MLLKETDSLWVRVLPAERILGVNQLIPALYDITVQVHSRVRLTARSLMQLAK